MQIKLVIFLIILILSSLISKNIQILIRKQYSILKIREDLLIDPRSTINKYCKKKLEKAFIIVK